MAGHDLTASGRAGWHAACFAGRTGECASRGARRGSEPAKSNVHMPYGLYISAEGARSQSQRLETIANNLANVDTAGFKRELAVFQARYSEAIAASRTEKLDGYLKVLYVLLEDLLQLRHGAAARVRNRDLESRLEKLARAVSFPWLKKAAEKVDELHSLLRRNIQKGIALDALVLELRRATSSPPP